MSDNNILANFFYTNFNNDLSRLNLVMLVI